MTGTDAVTAVTQAEDNLRRLVDRRDRAMDGCGPAPHPSVIAAAEAVLEAARDRLRRVMPA